LAQRISVEARRFANFITPEIGTASDVLAAIDMQFGAGLAGFAASRRKRKAA
jgi:hypothetical protein